MKNLTIGAKVILGFAIILLLAIIIGVAGIRSVNRIGNEFNYLAETQLPSVQAIEEIALGFEQLRAAQRTLLNPNLKEGDRKRQYTNIDNARQRYTKYLAIYDPLPKSQEEERVYRQLQEAITEWRKANDEFDKAMDELARLDIHYPMKFLKDLETFRADHYSLQEQVLTALQTRRSFEGGEDPTTCNLGRWLPTLESKNRELTNIINSMRPHHDKFHHTVKDIKQELQNRNYDEALQLYQREMAPAALEVFKYFGQLIHFAEQAVELFEAAEYQNMEMARLAQNKALGHLTKLTEIINADVESQIDVSHKVISNSMLMSIILLIIAAILAFAVGFVISRGVNEIIASMMNTVKRLVGAATDGKLDVRANPEEINFEFREIAVGINNVLDAVIAPLNVAAEYIDRISKGDIPAKITDTYKGDFNEIKNNLNAAIDVMNGLQKETDVLIGAVRNGDLTKRARANQFTGGWETLLDGVNDLIEAFVTPINVTADYVDRISKGAIPEKITAEYKGDFNKIKNNLNQAIDALNGLITEMGKLTKSAVDGRLAERGDGSKFQGDYRAIIQGVNETLEAIMGPVNEAASVMQRVAQKDMTARVTGNYKGDLDAFKNDINKAVADLDQALSQVAEAADQVTSASGQISSGSQSLAEGANEQASSLEEVSSSLEEMSSMVNQNADNATQARNLSAEARKFADEGNKAMEKMTDAIGKIKGSSDETAKIVKTIDDIAFQTNLLALNAAVEAARAGDAGRGFAVVAEEVRALAQRSAEAAKSTTSLIEGSVGNANAGVQITDEVAKLLQQIVGGSAKVNDLVAEIAAASKEQATGIEQVNQAVAELNKVTQQNAANSEESASAAEELNSQASELTVLVNSFSLSHSTVRPSGMRSAPTHHPKPAPRAPQRSVSRPAPKAINTEKVIPLDDEDFGDF
jgi:methyl-accepting chemotaxis protein